MTTSYASSDLQDLAVNKLNEILQLKGIPIVARPPPNDWKKPKTEVVRQKPSERQLERDFDINDEKAKFILTKDDTQKRIMMESGARIETKGKFYPDRSMATDRDPPMFLHVTATSKSALEKATKMINEIMERGRQVIERGGLTEGGMGRGPPKPEVRGLLAEFEAGYSERKMITGGVEEKVYMPPEIAVEDYPYFKIRAKLVGPGGSLIKQIQLESNTRVHLKGQGSGYMEVSTGQEADEPLHVFISGASQENIDKAKLMLSELFASVVERYNEWKQDRMGEQAPLSATSDQQQQQVALTGDPNQDYAMYFAWYKQYYESMGYPDAETIAAQFAAQSLQQAMAAQTTQDVPPPPEEEIPPPPEEEIPPPPEEDVPPPPEEMPQEEDVPQEDSHAVPPPSSYRKSTRRGRR